jgi:hypothetical protein
MATGRFLKETQVFERRRPWVEGEVKGREKMMNATELGEWQGLWAKG